MGVIQRLRKTAKIVDCFRRFHRRHARATSEPMRRDHHNGFRARQRFPQLLPGAGINVIFQNIHRATVTQKQCWHTS